MIANDDRKILRFAPSHGDAARALLASVGRTPESLESVALVADGKLYERSDATLRIATYLRSPFPAFAALLALPASLRDRSYGVIARNRYRWFGTHELEEPSAELRDRFL